MAATKSDGEPQQLGLASPSAAPAAVYTAEEHGFHKHFPQVPLNEKLVEDYSCSYSKNKIIRPGRLYVTAVRLCFYPSIGHEVIHVLWQDVLSIVKKTRLFVGVIDVETTQGAYTFTAFSYGVIDGALKTLQMLESVRSKYAAGRASSSASGASASLGATGSPSLPPATTPPAPSQSFGDDIGANAENGPERLSTAEDEGEPLLLATPSGSSGSLRLASTPTPPLLGTTPDNGSLIAATEVASGPPSSGPKATSGAREGSQLDANNESSSPFDALDATSRPYLDSSSSVLKPLSPEAVAQEEDSTTLNKAAKGTTGDSGSAQGSLSTTPNSSSPAMGPTNTSNTLLDSPPEDALPPPQDGATSVQKQHVTPGTPVTHTHTAEEYGLPIKHQRSVSDSIMSSSRTSPATNALPSLSKSFGALSIDEQRPESLVLQPPEEQGLPVPTEEKEIGTTIPPPPARSRTPTPPKGISTPLPAEKMGADKPERQSRKGRRGQQEGDSSDILTGQSRDVLRHFPKVPKTENILDVFQCSYVAGVHRIGKLYITGHYILFNSVLISEGIAINFADIASIAKQQTILVLDGIVITTKTAGEKYEFTSFLSRDSAYSIMKQLFDTHKATELVMGARKQSAVDPDDLIERSTDIPVQKQRTSSPTSPSSRGLPPASATAAAVASAAGVRSSTPTATSPTLGPSGIRDGSPLVGNRDESVGTDEGEGGGQSSFKTSTSVPPCQPCDYPAASSIDVWDNYGTEFEFSPMATIRPSKVVFEDKTLPEGCDLNDVFRICFDDDTKVNLDYHVARKDTENRWEPWKPCEPVGGDKPPPYSGQRNFNCTTVIKALTATSCPFTEFQKYVFLNVDDTPTLLVGLSGQARGVMYSETFRVEQLIYLTQKGTGSSAVVTMKVTCFVRFLTSVWIRGKITSNTLSETRGCFEKLFGFMCDALEADRERRQGALAPAPMPTQAAFVKNEIAEGLAGANVTPPPVCGNVAEREGVQQRPQPLPRQLIVASRVTFGVAVFYILYGLWTLFWFDTSAYLPPLRGAVEVTGRTPTDTEVLLADTSLSTVASVNLVGNMVVAFLRPPLMALLLLMLTGMPLLAQRLCLL